MSVVRLVRGAVGRPDAETIGRRALRTPEARVERELFYPYYWYLLRASWATLFGAQTGKVSCLVDARARIASTSDPFETEPVEAGEEGLLGAKLGEGEAEQLARRVASRALGRRQRALAPPEWSVVDAGLVHKRFWVVRHDARRLLVDGVTGRVHPLGPVG